jgi:carboxylesterase
MPGAEPFSAAGGPEGALVLHGFTGNPSSVRGIAEKLADAGLTVEAPLLPGHGTALADLVSLGWGDWSAAAEHAYAELAARCARVVVVGLSMGGGLACWLATRHLEICGIVLVNPLVAPPADDFRAALRKMCQEGATIAPSIGSDIARTDVEEVTYDGTPLAAALSLFDGVEEVASGLSEIHCPVLLFSSRQDHVVPTTNGDLVVSSVSGPCERVWLENSFHVATLDNDRDELEARTVTFVTAVTAGADA